MAKAVGIKGDYLPDVVDATAGLGAMPLCWLRSAAACGMLERNPVVAALLDDGWRVVMRMRKSAAGYRNVCS